MSTNLPVSTGRTIAAALGFIFPLALFLLVYYFDDTQFELGFFFLWTLSAFVVFPMLFGTGLLSHIIASVIWAYLFQRTWLWFKNRSVGTSKSKSEPW
jgi:hypothetical protein